MPMSKLRWLSLLMGLTILCVAGFQAYWLKENYDREKNSLLLRTQFHFREVMMALQVSKFNIPVSFDSTGSGTMKVFVKDGNSAVTMKMRPHSEMISTINVMRDRVRDSVKGNRQQTMIWTDKTELKFTPDSSMRVERKFSGSVPNQFFQLLYGVDSLQDSIRVMEIDSAMSVALDKEGIGISFSVKRFEAETEDDTRMHRVTLGIKNPVTYELSLGNSFSYLLKKITLPILFSLLLLGITITSFVLLYRNFVKQKKLAELKAEFISNITHELKTPIATVGVAIEALKNFNAIHNPERTKEYLDISSNELQRLSLLVDKVLKLSMFEKKELGLKMEHLDVGQLVDEVVASLRLQFEKNQASVEVHKKGNLTVEGDRLHLLSVVYNLIDNALKYSASAPQIQVELEGGENELVMTVADRGIGIPAEYHEKVFEKFFRVPHGNLHNAKGYGLGLSYVAQVVRKHNGRIKVEERAGGGSIFTLTIPKKQG